MDKRNRKKATLDGIEPEPFGCMFVDPKTLPGKYQPAKAVDFRAAAEYAKKIKAEEGRDVTSEELQRFAFREEE